jgi:hypothetical protein
MVLKLKMGLKMVLKLKMGLKMVLKLKMGLKTFLDLKNLVIDIVSRIGNKISSLSFFKYLYTPLFKIN